MADALDSKSNVGDYVWVQVPPPAPIEQAINLLFFIRNPILLGDLLMAGKDSAVKQSKTGINVWKETFRKHSKSEYKELFFRGLTQDGQVNRVHPWMYLRAFGICATIFALFAAVVYLTYTFVHDGAIQFFGYPSLITVAGLLLNVPILFLLFELYPKKDFSFIKLCVVMIICVVITDVIVNLGYCLLIPQNEWLSVLWTVFLEEFAKAVTALTAIYLCKRKSPAFGLLVGGAVGVGMAISEDIGYVFIASWQQNTINFGALLGVTALRSITSIAGHFIWTGLIGWAFVKFCRPLINIKFWLICLLAAALHYTFDFPYGGAYIFALALSVGAGLWVFSAIVKKERKEVFVQADAETQHVLESEQPDEIKTENDGN